MGSPAKKWITQSKRRRSEKTEVEKERGMKDLTEKETITKSKGTNQEGMKERGQEEKIKMERRERKRNIRVKSMKIENLRMVTENQARNTRNHTSPAKKWITQSKRRRSEKTEVEEGREMVRKRGRGPGEKTTRRVKSLVTGESGMIKAA